LNVTGFLDYPPDLPIPDSSPSPDDLAAIIFNEHRSAHGPELDDSIAAMAHVLLYRMSAGIPFGKGTAAATLPERISDDERRFLEKAQKATNQALAERARGIDPTHGAIFWRHQTVDPRWSPEFARDWFATETFQNTPLAHSFGPFRNSVPSRVLPKGHPIYLNIYGDRPWGDESRDE